MEVKYKFRIVLTILVLVGAPIFYGLMSSSDNAKATLVAVSVIPYIFGRIFVLALVGSGIEHVVRALLKRYGKRREGEE